MTRILVVEDEESFADPCPTFCAGTGMRLPSPPAVSRAVAEFDRRGADLVMLDVLLPGMRGGEVLRRLRQRSSVPVIFLTAKDSEVDRGVGLEMPPGSGGRATERSEGHAVARLPGRLSSRLVASFPAFTT